MPSEKISELMGILGELESRLKQFDVEARRLVELRGDLMGTTAALQSAGKELQAVASALREGASTMRELDMAAALQRIAEIEAALDIRSNQLEAAIDREVAALGTSLKQQVSTQLAELPSQIGPAVAAAFDKQFKATKRAIDSLVADADSRHNELLEGIRKGIKDQAAISKAAAVALDKAIEESSASAREERERQLTALLEALKKTEAAVSVQTTANENLVKTGFQKLRRLSGVAILFAAAAFLAAVFIIFTLHKMRSP